MTKKKRRMIFGASLAILLAGWVFLNPPGRFGFCAFGLTTYGCIPRPASDVQVRCDGATRSVEKTHALKLEHVQWLLEPMPSILIIGIGWDGAVHSLEQVKDLNALIFEANRKRFGDLHPATVSALHNLAVAYFLADDREFYAGKKDWDAPDLRRASELFAEAAEKGKALYGEDHPSPYSSQFMHGVTRLNLGEYDVAEGAFREVAEANERLSGPDSQGVFSAKGQLARLYIRLERFEEARDLMAGAVDGAERVLGEDHTATQVYRYRLGIALMHLGAYEESESALLTAHGYLLESRGPEHDWTQWCAKVLSEHYERRGRPDLADEWMAKVDPDWNAAMEEIRQLNTAPFYD